MSEWDGGGGAEARFGLRCFQAIFFFSDFDAAILDRTQDIRNLGLHLPKLRFFLRPEFVRCGVVVAHKAKLFLEN